MLHHVRDHRRTATAPGERGASTAEYGLLIAGIAAVVVALVLTLGATITDRFKDTNDCVASASHSATDCPTAAPTP